MKKVILASAVTSLFILSSCRDTTGYTESAGLNTQTPTIQTGYYVDAEVEGVEYKCGVVEGNTTKEGAFDFEVGKDCLFSLGGFELRRILFDKLDENITILEDNEEIAQILQTLDNDGNASNGIQIGRKSGMILKGILKEKRVEIKEKLLETLPEDLNLTNFLEEVHLELKERVENYKGRVIKRKDAIAHVRNTIKHLLKHNRRTQRDGNVTDNNRTRGIGEELSEFIYNRKNMEDMNNSERRENFHEMIRALKEKNHQIRLEDDNQSREMRDELIKELKGKRDDHNLSDSKEMIFNMLENIKERRPDLKDLGKHIRDRVGQGRGKKEK